MFGHILEPLTEILFPLMKCWKIIEIKVEMSWEKRAAPDENWVLEGGIEIPATFYVYGARIHKLHVRKMLNKGKNKKETIR